LIDTEYITDAVYIRVYRCVCEWKCLMLDCYSISAVTVLSTACYIQPGGV